jgi:opacity protein-like surface antigen
MRIAVIVGLALVGAASQARAADFGPLRGSMLEVTGVSDFSGVYAGVQTGFSNAGMNFANAANPLVEHLLRNTATASVLGTADWAVLGDANPNGTSFGGFVGYNWQWDAAVVGLEINYNRTSLTSTSTDSMSRWSIQTVDASTVPPTQYRYSATVGGSASLTLTDFGTFRLKGGHAFGQFMPYGFVAAAVGRVNYSKTADVFSQIHDVTGGGNVLLSTYSPATARDSATTFIYGGAVGLGVDVLLTNNLFVRAEWEYVQFQPFEGFNLNVNSVRAAAGAKF